MSSDLATRSGLKLRSIKAKSDINGKNGLLHTTSKDLDGTHSTDVAESEDSAHSLGHLLLLVQQLYLEAVQAGAIDVQ